MIALAIATVRTLLVGDRKEAELPEKWKRLNVHDNRKALGVSTRLSYPTRLYIVKKVYSENIYSEWLPLEEEDTRPRKEGKKRRAFIVSTGSVDPRKAAQISIAWVVDKQKELLEEKDVQEGKIKNSLLDYWDEYFKKESRSRTNQRNFNRWKREEVLKWEADEYGIKNQQWSQFSCDQITRSDLQDYFDLLEGRARKSNNGNGSGMKGQQKTLINKLFAIAESDFVGHSFPSFPAISKQKKQVRHLTQDEWKLLLRTVFELGEGKEAITWSADEYKNLEWSPHNRQNPRNWVDLWDALNLEWFFYLRAEDMYRLRCEWFKETKEGWFCDLETTKKDRPIHRTTHYRKDAEKFMKRLMKRKTNGYLIFPHIARPDGNEADSHVLKTLNFLLKKAMTSCLSDFPKEGMKWTTIRHTAFRLTLEEDPSLGVQPKINSFADNGHTSAQQLRDTYLRFIELEKTAMEAREKIEPSREVRWGGKYKSRKDIEGQPKQ